MIPMAADLLCMRTTAEAYYPRKKTVPEGFLQAIVGETEREVENQRAEQVVSAGNIDQDLRKALQVLNYHHLAMAHSN